MEKAGPTVRLLLQPLVSRLSVCVRVHDGYFQHIFSWFFNVFWS